MGAIFKVLLEQLKLHIEAEKKKKIGQADFCRKNLLKIHKAETKKKTQLAVLFVCSSIILWLLYKPMN